MSVFPTRAMLVAGLRYNPDEMYGMPLDTKSGSNIYSGTASGFHDWKFRTQAHSYGRTDPRISRAKRGRPGLPRWHKGFSGPACARSFLTGPSPLRSRARHSCARASWAVCFSLPPRGGGGTPGVFGRRDRARLGLTCWGRARLLGAVCFTKKDSRASFAGSWARGFLGCLPHPPGSRATAFWVTGVVRKGFLGLGLPRWGRAQGLLGAGPPPPGSRARGGFSNIVAYG